ncbi:MAG: GIY-YIG nuclease family protein [Methylocella sp.]
MKSKQKIWIVYVIIDPRTDTAAYVGCTTNFKRRIIKHRDDTESAVHQWGRAALAAGFNPLVRPVACFKDKDHATRLETELIAAIPGLLNRDIGIRQRIALKGAPLLPPAPKSGGLELPAPVVMPDVPEPGETTGRPKSTTMPLSPAERQRACYGRKKAKREALNEVVH